MIKIHKTDAAEISASFKRKGRKQKQTECELFDECPEDYLKDEVKLRKKLKVSEAIYQDSEIKTRLIKNHHFKCCYCETKFKYSRDLDVEHFRPKKYSQQSPNSKKILLVYFWLAYDWDNLLLSCAECNRVYKKNLFPLENEHERASAKSRNIDKELPTFINPAAPTEDDPRKHIKFIDETPEGITARGQKIIDYLGLRRDMLLEDRREHLDKLRRAARNHKKMGKDCSVVRKNQGGRSKRVTKRGTRGVHKGYNIPKKRNKK
jgi:uncharacterized protein (TIGR02646 family)